MRPLEGVRGVNKQSLSGFSGVPSSRKNSQATPFKFLFRNSRSLFKKSLSGFSGVPSSGKNSQADCSARSVIILTVNSINSISPFF